MFNCSECEIMKDVVGSYSMGPDSMSNQIAIVNKHMCHNPDHPSQQPKACEQLTSEIWPRFISALYNVTDLCPVCRSNNAEDLANTVELTCESCKLYARLMSAKVLKGEGVKLIQEQCSAAGGNCWDIPASFVKYDDHDLPEALNYIYENAFSKLETNLNENINVACCEKGNVCCE